MRQRLSSSNLPFVGRMQSRELTTTAIQLYPVGEEPKTGRPLRAGVAALAILQILVRLAVVAGALFLTAIKYSAIALLIVVVGTYFM